MYNEPGQLSLREKCHYSEFFWSVFLRFRIEYGEIRSTGTFHAVYVFEKICFFILFELDSVILK